MVVREAIYNAVLHGRPHRITIEVRFKPQQLSLTVTDDGMGFQVSDPQAEGHFGITGMRERMERAGGKITITSAPGSGTRVDLSIPRSVLSSRPREARNRGIHWDAIQ